MMNILQSLWKWILTKVNGSTPNPTPNPTPTPDPLPSIKWHGPIPQPNAVKDINLISANISGNKVTFNYDPLSWNADETNTLVCGFVMRDGQLEGGKFDWLRKGQKLKELVNLTGQRKKNPDGSYMMDANGNQVYSYYIKAIIPLIKGESFWMAIMKSDGSHISNVVKASGGLPSSSGATATTTPSSTPVNP